MQALLLLQTSSQGDYSWPAVETKGRYDWIWSVWMLLDTGTFPPACRRKISWPLWHRLLRLLIFLLPQNWVRRIRLSHSAEFWGIQDTSFYMCLYICNIPWNYSQNPCTNLLALTTFLYWNCSEIFIRFSCIHFCCSSRQSSLQII